jgi:Flp pilus assembly protein TadG
MRARWRPRSVDDAGSATVEMVLLAPVLVLLLLLVIWGGRAGSTVTQVRHAADQAARAASMVHESRMAAVAESAALLDLAGTGVACREPVVGTIVARSSVPATVTVTVRCRVDSSGVAALVAASRSVVASSTEVVDRFRSEVGP